MADDAWTVKRILEWIEGYLAQHGDDKPRASAQWLVAEALGVSKMQLFIDLERPLSPDERATLREYTRRRASGEPLQYITGTVDFRHITVKVRPGVLIPRPETEVLVSEALALLPAAGKPQDKIDADLIRRFVELGGEIEGASGKDADDLHADGAEAPDRAYEPEESDMKAGTLADAQEQDGLGAHDGETERHATGARTVAELPGEPAADSLLVADICTGSGCIACSIAREHPRTHVIATDISPAAVALARENAASLELDGRLDVLECDLGEGIGPALLGAFDLVVSNPPYVPTGVLADIPREVTDFEPGLALDGGADGLDVFRRLLEWCSNALKPGGGFAFELHETRLDDAADLARTAGFADVRVARDLADRPRILVGRKPQR